MELADTPNTLNAPVAPGVPGDPTADPVFVEEQDHLSATYAKLQELERACAGRLAANREEMQQFKSTMDDELGADFDGDDIAMETYAEYAVMNNVVDSFNIAIDLDSETLKRLRILLASPTSPRCASSSPASPSPATSTSAAWAPPTRGAASSWSTGARRWPRPTTASRAAP